jgi:hypothetical protein
MKNTILAVALLAFAAVCGAQSYTPLQGGHTGVWGNPERSGEGIMPAAQLVDGAPFVFASIYVIDGGETLGYFAQGATHEECERGLCVLDVYRRAEVNGPAIAVGTVVLETLSWTRLSWHLAIEDGPRTILRTGNLVQILAPAGAPVGGCNMVGGFSPPRPNAGVWCE